jgi:hypothetical protein
MFTVNTIRHLVLILLIAVLTAAGAFAQAAPKPITRTGLVEALRLGGLSPAELVQFVQKRGVDFQITESIERELRDVGATPELVSAVKSNYRAAAAPERPQSPPPSAAPAAASPAPAAAGPQGARTLSEVHKIFIDKMPNDLDQYLRAEISKQLPTRLVVVLNREDADAIMTGVGDHKTGTGAVVTGRYLGLHDNATGAISIVDKSGTLVLWSSEAGDRSILMGAVKRGGPRKVADRLIHNLRKAMGL